MSNTQKKNVPELRFPGFEGEWGEKKLGEVASFAKGKLGAKKDVSQTGVPIILYGELYTKYGAIVSKIFSKTDIPENKLKMASKNDVLIPSSGETAIDIATASCIYLNKGVAVGGDINILTPHKQDGRFISLSINGINKNELSKYAQGKTVVHLYNNDIKNLKIAFPSQFEEQVRIGDFFSKLDRQIELEEQKLELLQQQKKGYMQKIFSQELRFKDENGNDYPDWTNENFKDLFKVVPSKKYQIKSSEIIESGKIPVVDQGKKLILGFSNQTDKVYKEFNNVIIYGDHTTIIKKMDVPFIIGGDGVKLLTPISNNNLDYFFSILQYFNIDSEGYKRHFSILKDKNFYTANSNKEQQKIGCFFKSLDLIINKQFTYLELLKSYKKGIIQKMFV
ncbi:restriction endonuclease subunit S [Staphylococcus aureus]|uniref:restriction endonuclease subunit S n=1 Tax=Staphylococcus aureus TaxID=1280 RepID=UPI000F5FDA79|nr:restriction endonuclease subunit S [Staphylococcus aureus]MCJ8111189.1 restriction endonuclease subunit S [Staphylococcus aureus]MCM0450538.1 restriction endonuclease subunit S [Staphylococcus aureus]MCM0455829.1 restriction endonuclease subunit S [Staphylococcus aureus]MCM0460963.1 restriction endonuclease subunit S [Staphylococcus aureus]MCM0463418.1 restriction endonuclease subunit S [Staphylococcus aureus]